MVPITSLLLPVLVSAVAVFFVSWLVHMVLRYHHKDWVKLPNEDGVMNALRSFNIPPGDYMMPCGSGPESMKDPAFIEKFKQGPVATMTFMPAGKWNMGQSLIAWFILCLVIGGVVAVLTGKVIAPGADKGTVFSVAALTGFASFSFGQWQDSIWYKRKWSTTIKNTIDGFIYGLVIGVVFSAMWPGA